MSGRAPVSPEQQVQDDLVRLDAYRSQLNQLLQQHQLLGGSRADHERARETLEALDGIDAQREIVIPLGAEAYVRGTAQSNAPVLIGMGSGVVAEIDRAKAIELLHERLKRLDGAGEELDGQIRMLEERIESLSQRIESLTQGGDGSGGRGSNDVGGD